MDMMLNDILPLNMDQIANSRIELNMNAGIGGETFIDKWLRFADEERQVDEYKECSYWG